MAVDRDRVEERATYIRSQVADVTCLLQSRRPEEILRDPWLLRGIRYALQTSIDAMIDIAFHVCAKGLKYAAQDGRDAMRKLADAGILKREDVSVFHTMIGFRNRIVHGYLAVSDERVLEMASTELGDFDRFLAQVFEYLDRRGVE